MGARFTATADQNAAEQLAAFLDVLDDETPTQPAPLHIDGRPF
jgi:hypothetical protein